MAVPDLTFLHAPSLYDFRKRATLWGPISDVVPSTPVYDMYPIGFAVLSDSVDPKLDSQWRYRSNNANAGIVAPFNRPANEVANAA